MSLSLRALAREAVFLVRMRASERRFARHLRQHCRHVAQATQHVAGMVEEVQLREDLCARRGGRPGPPAPRSSSGVPLVPRPLRQVADSPADGAATVPGRDGVFLTPEGR